jgi:hypothetical protein
LIWRVSQGVIHNREAPPSPAHFLGHGGGIYQRIYNQFMLRDFAYLLTLVDYRGSGESMHLFLVVADIGGYGGDGGWQAAAGLRLRRIAPRFLGRFNPAVKSRIF